MAFKAYASNPVAVAATTGAQLISTSQPCGAIFIEAFASNTQPVYIADAGATLTLAALNGKRLDTPVAGSPLGYFSIPCGSTPKSNNLNQIYAVASGALQKVNIFYEDD